MLIKIAARIVVGLPRFSRGRIAPVCIVLYVLQIKARIKYEICLLAHKAAQCKEPLYLNEMLELRKPSTINSRSKYDTWKSVKNRVPGPGFTIRSLNYCARHFYNNFPKNYSPIK